jgi:hypothetical protein
MYSGNTANEFLIILVVRAISLSVLVLLFGIFCILMYNMVPICGYIAIHIVTMFLSIWNSTETYFEAFEPSLFMAGAYELVKILVYFWIHGMSDWTWIPWYVVQSIIYITIFWCVQTVVLKEYGLYESVVKYLANPIPRASWRRS